MGIAMKQMLLLAALAAAGHAQADALTDWNVKCGEFITESKLGTPPAVRVMALVQTAARDAVESALQQRASTDAALANVADSAAKTAGITAGEAAANMVLAARMAPRPRVTARTAAPASMCRRACLRLRNGRSANRG
jgi:hypothetical protein